MRLPWTGLAIVWGMVSLPLVQVLAYLAAFEALDSATPDVLPAHFRAMLGLGAALMGLSLVWHVLRTREARPGWIAFALALGAIQGAVLAWNLPNDFGGFLVLYEFALVPNGVLWGSLMLVAAMMITAHPTRNGWAMLAFATAVVASLHAVLLGYFVIRIEFLANASANASRAFLPGHGWLATVAALGLAGLGRTRRPRPNG